MYEQRLNERGYSYDCRGLLQKQWLNKPAPRLGQLQAFTSTSNSGVWLLNGEPAM